jgi:hypothetical protein
MFFLGMQGSEYQIRFSGLPNDRPLEIEFEKFTIGFSKIISGNGAIKVGWRDKPIQARGGEDDKRNITYISQHFVVLYDVGDHRGFLLDGASALLHLVRTSIIEDQKNGLIQNIHESRTVNDSIQLDDRLDPKRRAMNALWNDENARLRLYKRSIEEDTKIEVKTVFEVPEIPKLTTEEIASQKGHWVCFKDRVIEIWWMLDQAINIQTDGTALRAKLKNFTGKTKLEGYEFKNLALSNRACLRFTKPKSNSEGWLDLVRELPAVTLFGRGFGEIIKHNAHAPDAHTMCPEWKSVPKKRGYLAMSSATLEDVLESGISETWQRQNPFELCKPSGQICNRRHFLVNGQNKRAQKTTLDVQKNGAVIIGHEPFTVSRFMKSFRHQRKDGNQEAATSSMTRVESQSCLGSTSEETSRLTALSSAIRSSDSQAHMTPNTTIETPQGSLKKSSDIKLRYSFEHLPNIANEPATSSGPSMSVEQIEASRSMNLPYPNANNSTPNFDAEASQTRTLFSVEDARVVVTSDTAPVIYAPSCLLSLPSPENSQIVSQGRKESIRGCIRRTMKFLLRSPKRNDT